MGNNVGTCCERNRHIALSDVDPMVLDGDDTSAAPPESAPQVAPLQFPAFAEAQRPYLSASGGSSKMIEV